MKKEIRQQYEMLVSFLGKVLGPCYEIVLHEIKGEEIKCFPLPTEKSAIGLWEALFLKNTEFVKRKVYEKEDLVLNEICYFKNSKNCVPRLYLSKITEKWSVCFVSISMIPNLMT